jgi:glycosyltransferase involved in cell wall biosynthesis
MPLTQEGRRRGRGRRRRLDGRHPGTRRFELSPPGPRAARVGRQLNAGAAAASGDVLLFLHADVAPPPDAALQIRGAVERGRVGGNFRLRYPEGGVLGRWLEALAPFYCRFGRYYGDSGIFVMQDVYERVGGFSEITVMEDIVFVCRMEGAGKTAYLPGPRLSSSRRWEGRPLCSLALWGSCRRPSLWVSARGVSPPSTKRTIPNGAPNGRLP